MFLFGFFPAAFCKRIDFIFSSLATTNAMLSPLKENDMNLPQPVLSPSKQASNPNAGNPGIPSGNPPAPSSEPSDEDIMLQLAGKTEKAAGGSLQGNFAKFRAERARQKKLARANKKHLKESPKTQEQVSEA